MSELTEELRSQEPEFRMNSLDWRMSMGSRIPTVYRGASAVGGFPDLRRLALSTIGWGLNPHPIDSDS
ncbi:hypothetical protein [Brasilonema sp. UFV-L1]|uniref:hypothetical protein n=1 Tax=Brasilonema sp. UFV-L1 TaxID=2234130 RepID=UPI00145DC438|nr:hypothetical protein [Brasilonema sp. UFV-L1]